MGPLRVHIHAFALDNADHENEWTLLSAPERARANRFVHALDRQRFTACRAHVRRILGETLNQAPEAVEIAIDSHGKPYCPSTALHFNVSHTGADGVIALAMAPLGIDIEAMRPLEEDIARRFFSPDEVAALNALSSETYWLGFYRCWTRKEAFVKAKGQGLSLPLDGFSVSIGDAPCLLRCDFDPAAIDRYRLTAFSTAPGVVGALCVATDGRAMVVTGPST
jgi:4'-phosphopantetheinyl transferase